jgi:hypothetical protein
MTFFEFFWEFYKFQLEVFKLVHYLNPYNFIQNLIRGQMDWRSLVINRKCSIFFCLPATINSMFNSFSLSPYIIIYNFFYVINYRLTWKQIKLWNFMLFELIVFNFWWRTGSGWWASASIWYSNLKSVYIRWTSIHMIHWDGSIADVQQFVFLKNPRAFVKSDLYEFLESAYSFWVSTTWFSPIMIRRNLKCQRK